MTVNFWNLFDVAIGIRCKQTLPQLLNEVFQISGTPLTWTFCPYVFGTCMTYHSNIGYSVPVIKVCPPPHTRTHTSWLRACLSILGLAMWHPHSRCVLTNKVYVERVTIKIDFCSSYHPVDFVCLYIRSIHQRRCCTSIRHHFTV